jgi:hypothetical protein
MWIKLTRKDVAVGEAKVLVNTDNVTCAMTGQSILNKGETLVCFAGEGFISVEESVDKVEEIIKNGLKGGENNDD